LPAEHTSHRLRSFESHSGRSTARLERRCKPAWQDPTSAPVASTRSRLTSMSAARTVATGYSSRNVALRSKSYKLDDHRHHIKKTCP
jgi:hypothetical protein